MEFLKVNEGFQPRHISCGIEAPHLLAGAEYPIDVRGDHNGEPYVKITTPGYWVTIFQSDIDQYCTIIERQLAFTKTESNPSFFVPNLKSK